MIRPGVTTLDIESFAVRFFKENGANAFPALNIGSIVKTIPSYVMTEQLAHYRESVSLGMGLNLVTKPRAKETCEINYQRDFKKRNASRTHRAYAC
ncbi:hypothetical protein FHS15_005660 [Paenibacillus castaneae]|uniref:hypothetical protein n=1 Tax=Paenibacillus castaneae TaxID=474957 RepID=UPI001FBAA8CB|nr:hypothetical protein [Paenibacillus castaneae]NIK80470.1 hypothetical protein [Paenibacillus castaneae]